MNGRLMSRPAIHPLEDLMTQGESLLDWRRSERRLTRFFSDVPHLPSGVSGCLRMMGGLGTCP